MYINLNLETRELLGEDDDPQDYEFDRTESYPIEITYIVDSPAEYERVLVAEYEDTGGKDYERILKKPQEGHYSVVFADNKLPIPYDFPEPVGIPDTGDTYDDQLYIDYWRELTPEEKAEKAKIREEEEKKQEEIQEFVETGSDRLGTVETTQDDIVLLLADIVGGAV